MKLNVRTGSLYLATLPSSCAYSYTYRWYITCLYLFNIHIYMSRLSTLSTMCAVRLYSRGAVTLHKLKEHFSRENKPSAKTRTQNNVAQDAA